MDDIKNKIPPIRGIFFSFKKYWWFSPVKFGKRLSFLDKKVKNIVINRKINISVIKSFYYIIYG